MVVCDKCEKKFGLLEHRNKWKNSKILCRSCYLNEENKEKEIKRKKLEKINLSIFLPAQID